VDHEDDISSRRTANQVLSDAERANLRLVRFLYCDYGGIVRGKATHAAGLADRLDEGIALTTAQLAMNARDELQDIPGMTPVGEVRIVPDPRSFTILPYVPNTGAMMSDLVTLDRMRWAACPRAFLRRMIDRAGQNGMMIEAVFENEFFLAQDEGGSYSPADNSLCFSTTGMNAQAEFTDDLIAALEAQGIQVEQAMPEYGGGQQEISIRHAPALDAADHQIIVRETARAIAGNHGLVASFAPKPFPDQIGSGAHVHISFWDTASGENIFHDPSAPRGFSEIGRRFTAGILAHLPALVALTCPTVNSFRRLQPHAWASAFVAWGFDNREAAVRVPSTFWGREQGTTNVELKTVDNTCNPYLALGAIVAAGLDGIERGLDPGEPFQVDPGKMTEAERESRGATMLPGSLEEALSTLSRDQVITEALGQVLHRAYAAVRQSEADSYRELDEVVEFREHLSRY
jgi:glutamine synthetase